MEQRSRDDVARSAIGKVNDLGEERVRPALGELRQLVLARRDRDRHRAARARAVDVERSVADDGDALERDRPTDEGVRALARDGRQSTTVGIVRAVRADAEERPEPGGAKLETRAGLDVAGQEPDDGVLLSRERADISLKPMTS